MPFAVHARHAGGTPGRLIGIHPGEDRHSAQIDIERNREDLGLAGLDIALVHVGPEGAEQLRRELAAAGFTLAGRRLSVGPIA